MSTSPHDEEPNELRPRDLFLDWVADNQTAFSPSRHDLERLVNASACSSTRRNVHVRRSALLAAGLAVAAAVIAALVSALASSADVTPPLVVVNEPLVVDTPVPASDTNIIETLEPWAAAALESDVRLDWRGTELAALELIYWDARGESTPRPGQHVPPPAYDRRGPPPPRRAPSPLDLVLERGEEVGLDRGRLEALEDEVIAAEPNRMQLQEDLLLAREAAELVLQSIDWDQEAVVEALDAISAAEHALRLHDVRMVYQLRELLTEDDVDMLMQVFPPVRPER
ncbi:MAG: hypothetical protein ACI81R_001832 [Bradymonadia bacterium]|jgi:hypothetical protein